MFSNVFLIVLSGFMVRGGNLHLQNPRKSNVVYQSHNPDRDNPSLIRLKMAKFSTLQKGAPKFDRIGLEGKPYKKGEKGYWIIQFTGPIRNEWKGKLKEIGIEFPGEFYVPNHALIARADSALIDRAQGFIFVQWVGRYKPAYRIYPGLLHPQYAEQDRDLPGTVMLKICVFNGEDFNSILSNISSIEGVSILKTSSSGRWATDNIIARVPEENATEIAISIANLNGIEWVERYFQPHILNSWTSWISQSYNTTGKGDATSTGWYAQLAPDATHTPLYSHGIYGEGQIVGISDTGIDWDGRYFGETSSTMNFNAAGTAFSGTGSHKIQGYQTLSDDHDDASGYGSGSEGHGTHTSGTIAGDSCAVGASDGHDPSVDGILARGEGQAPRAKLAFQDISTSGSGGSLDGIPSNLNDLFQWAYNAGARIHSNSWGSSATNYTSNSSEVDEFMWNNKDFLIFFAMGNSGPGNGTIGSPATAKNLISIGATQSGSGTVVADGGYANNTQWQNPGDVSDTYGNGWNTDGIPDDDPETMAWFSSHGPSDEGLRKPEICTPGGIHIYSAFSDGDITTGNPGNSSTSDGNSNGTYLCQMGGTSMATPAAAGLCALVRQYYTEGWYPSGSANASDAITPSAALMKATMIASARNMTGYYTSDNGSATTHADIPNNGQGWGRVTLDDALYFSGDTMGTLIYDNLTVAQGGTDLHSFTAGNTCDLKVVLAYTDYYGLQSASDPLVNDLDLRVVVDGTSYRGNVFSGGYSTTGGTYDNVNPVEVVLIPKSSLSKGKSSVEVRVIGTEVNYSNDEFALVITGNVNQTMAVDISNFTYSVVEDGIRIYWRAETDVNTKKWEVERALAPSNEYSVVYTINPLLEGAPHNYSYKDTDCTPGKVYKYRLVKVSTNDSKKHYGPLYIRYTGNKLKFGITNIKNNLFTDNFWFEYAIPTAGYTEIKIYDIMGRDIKTLLAGEKKPGKYQMKWDARDMPQGIYFLKLNQGGNSQVIKIVKIQ